MPFDFQNVPGLRGWIAADQERQQAIDAQQNQQVKGLTLASMFQEQQKKKELEKILSTVTPQQLADPEFRRSLQLKFDPAKALEQDKMSELERLLVMQSKLSAPSPAPVAAPTPITTPPAAPNGLPVASPVAPPAQIAEPPVQSPAAKAVAGRIDKLTGKTERKKEVILQDGTIGILNLDTNKIEKTTEKARPTASALGSLNADMLSPDAITNAAEKFNMNGVMPSLGMGSAIAKSRILNKAAELAKAEGNDAKAQAYRQMAGKADQQALGQLNKQATMVGAFEKTANSNLQLAVSLSDQVSRSGVPIFDKWIQAGRKSIAGDPDVANFHAANETFINEYAKIMSGSMGNTAISDAARTNAHEVISHAYTKEQYRAVTNTLKIEMQNRIKGFNDQRDEIKNRLYGSPITSQPITPAAQPATGAVHWDQLK